MATRTGILSFVFVLLAAAVSLPAQQGPRLVLRVGKQGLTKQEFDVYLKRVAGQNRVDPRVMPERLRRVARSRAIDDEILFQEAVKAGVLRDPHIRRRLIDLYVANHRNAGISPRSFPDVEVRAFYEKHKRDFMTKPMVRLQARMFRPNTPKVEIDKFRAAALRDPAGLKGWRQLGLAKPGQTFATPLRPKQLQVLFRMRPGQVTEPIRDVFKTTYVFWVQGVRPAKQMSYRRARAKVVHRMIGARQRANTEALNRRLGSGRSKSPEQRKFEAAVAARIHRQFMTRRRILNTWLAKQKKPRAKLLEELRPRYRVAMPPR